jgi:hypothetical protein
LHHLLELISNPWVISLIVILFFGEYIPYSKTLWEKIASKLQTLSQWFLNTYEDSLYKHKESYIKDKKIKLRLNNIIARIIFFIISAIVIIFLEIFWELGFKSITKKLEKSGFASWSERKIRQLPPWAVLTLFSTPFIFMELLGIFALAAFVNAQFWLGVTLYLIKVLFFIPVHFILHVGKEKLLSITWFKIRYKLVNATLEWFKKTQTYIKIHNLIQTIKAYFRAIKERFSNTIKILKKAFEQSDILSDECEEIRQEILELREFDSTNDAMYKKFFNCIERHLKMKNEKS